MTSAPNQHSGSDSGAIEEIERLSAIFDMAYEGRKVRWRRFGDGAPLVLLHGGHGSWMHWLRNIRALAQRHTLWIPDMPGFHDSDGVPGDAPGPDRLPVLVDTLSATLDELVGKATALDLAGFSFGGLVAVHLARLRQRVQRIAVIGVAGHGTARRQLEPMISWRGKSAPEIDAAMRHNLAVLMLHDPRCIDSLAVEIHTRSCVRARFPSKSVSILGDLPRVLDDLDHPLLMLWGQHDVTAYPEVTGEILRGNRLEREWCVVPGAGHWVQYERPADVNAMLLGWFDPTRH